MENDQNGAKEILQIKFIHYHDEHKILIKLIEIIKKFFFV